ncbi:NADH-binding protein, partial [Halobacteriales archaeon QS_9_70_65]
ILTPRWVRTDRQPIYVDDLLEYLLGVLEAPATRNDSFEVGGPDVLTYETMLERIAEVVAGRRVPVVPLPVTSPRLSAGWLWLVTDVSLSAARPTVAGLRNTVVAADDSIRRHVDVELTPFDEAVRAVVDGRPTATAAPAAGEA